MRLFYNYLRISPLYALAFLQAGVKLRRSMPAQTRLVIQCYRRYGDVFHRSFEEWAGPERQLSGNPTLQGQAHIIGPEQAHQIGAQYTLVAVDRSLPLNDAIKAVEQALRDSGVFEPKKSPVHGVRSKTMWKALAVVYARARRPADELWRVGARVGLIDRWVGQIDPEDSKKTAGSSLIRRDLTLAVIRFLQLASLLAQSAALGSFPDIESPLITPEKQLVFAFENYELDRRLSQCPGEYDFVVAKSLQLAMNHTEPDTPLTL